MAKYFKCGGLNMPSVGLGTFMATDEKELEAALDAALEVGYRHIDTAYFYQNEAVIGKVLKKWFASGKLRREDIFLVTKCPPEGIHPDRIEEYLKKSLNNFGLDYVDLYLLHFCIGTKTVNGKAVAENPTDHIAIWKKMEEQVKAGRAKSIGLSNFNAKQIKRIIENSEIPPGNLQVELHVFLQQPELVKFCHDNNVSVVAYCPLANPGFNTTMKMFGLPEKEIPDGINNPTVVAIAKKHGKTSGQILLRYLLQNDIAVIPKSVKPARVRENFQLFDFSLDAEDMAALKKLDMGNKGRFVDFATVGEGVKDHPEYPF